MAECLDGLPGHVLREHLADPWAPAVQVPRPPCRDFLSILSIQLLFLFYAENVEESHLCRPVDRRLLFPVVTDFADFVLGAVGFVGRGLEHSPHAAGGWGTTKALLEVQHLMGRLVSRPKCLPLAA